MKKFIVLVMFALVINHSYSQCLSGDCQNGYGTFKYSDGEYIGFFKDGKKHGQGRYNYNNGGYYHGGWNKDERNGLGIKLKSGDYVSSLINSSKGTEITGETNIFTLKSKGELDDEVQKTQCISPDNNLFVIVTQKAIRLFELQSLKLVSTIPHDYDKVGAVGFLDNNQLLICGNTKTECLVSIFDWKTKKLIKSYNPIEKGKMTKCNYSIESKTLAIDGIVADIYITKPETQKIIRKVEGQIGLIRFEDDGKTLFFTTGVFSTTCFWYDIEKDEIKKSLKVKNDVVFQSLEKNIVITANTTSNSNIKIWNISTGKFVSNEDRYEGTVSWLTYKINDQLIFCNSLAAKRSSFCIFETQTLKQIAYIPKESKNEEMQCFNFNKQIITAVIDNINYLIDKRNLNVLGYLYAKGDQLCFISSDGRMEGGNDALANLVLSYKKITNSFTFKPYTSVTASSLISQRYTPHLLSSILAGTDQLNETEIQEMQKSVKYAPELTIIKPDSIYKSNVNKVTITFQTKENGDPVKETKFYINGKIFDNETRGFKTVKTGATSTIELPLLIGENIIQAIAFSQNNYQSSPDQVIVTFDGTKPESNLYLLCIGINKYKNPAYSLNFALADATAFNEQMKQNATGIFKTIFPTFISDEQATKLNILAAFKSIAEKSKDEDVFIMYYAGHGVMSEGTPTTKKDFYLVCSDITQLYGKDDLLLQKGISATEMSDLCKKINAQKQIIFLDACQSGAATETFAMRGAAEEKAIIQLANSTGIYMIASTGSEQFASEFKQLGHGIFTYALLEGMKGKADGSPLDKKVTIKELEAFLNDYIPTLSEKYKGSIQYPRTWSKGMDFPIIIIK